MMKKSFLIVLSAITLLFTACDSWMQNDSFYSDIANDVKVANAEQISVYVRYAMTRQGTTVPEGYNTFKVEIPHEISATTEPEYGFVRWAAFSTSFLATGDNQNQNKTVLYNDDEDYNSRLRPYEIKSPAVIFEDATKPTTKVTINVSRNDIFIVPLVTKRPAVNLSIPARGSSNVVRNSSVRVSFTKPMDPASFLDADAVSVTVGSVTIINGEMEIASRDIKNLFQEPQLSRNGKMLTMQFTPENLRVGYDAKSTVNVTISKEVKDTFGFSMVDDETISFTVGNTMDTLAPRIVQLTAGPGLQFGQFLGMYDTAKTGTWNWNNSEIRIHDNHSEGANTLNLDSGFFTGLVTGANQEEGANQEFIKNRISDKLTLRVFAKDLSSDTAEPQEADVAMIAIRSKVLYDNNGNQVTFTGTYDSDGNPTYDTNGNLTTSNARTIEYYQKGDIANLGRTLNPVQDYSELVINERDRLIDNNLKTVFGTSKTTAATSEPSAGVGCLYVYSLAEQYLPDGLIQIDVAGVDNVQNSGFTELDTATTPNISTLGNGYASIFVVKDTTAPDEITPGQIEFKDNNTALNQSKYYNDAVFSRLKISIPNALVDHGTAESLRSNKVYWTVKAIDDTVTDDNVADQFTSVAASAWKDTSVATDRSFSGFTSPTTDLVNGQRFAYALKDDMGNVRAAIIKADATTDAKIYYDRTAPELSQLSWTADSGYIDGVTSSGTLTNQTLVIPVTEATSGIKSIELSVTGGSNGATPFEYPFGNDGSGLTVYAGTTQITDYTASGKTLTFDDSIIPDNLRNFNSNITIKGIKISNAPETALSGTYTIKAKVTDAAENVTSAANETATAVTMVVDSTAPVIDYIEIKDIKKEVRYTDTTPTAEYWIDYNSSNLSRPSAISYPVTSVFVKFTEAGAGARQFTLDDYMYLIDVTGLKSEFYKVNYDSATGAYTRQGTAISGSISGRTFTANTPIGDATHPVNYIEITNVRLYSTNPSNYSSMKLTITDKAMNASALGTTIKSGSNEGITQFRYDPNSPSISSIKLEDKEAETGCDTAVAGYTNNEAVKATLTVTPTYSGVYELIISSSSRAKFVSTTTINDITSGTIALAFDVINDKTIRFKRTVGTDTIAATVGLCRDTSTRTLEITDLILDPQDPSHPDGDYSVSMQAKSFTGIAGSFSTENLTSKPNSTIKLDKTKPTWTNKGLHTYLPTDSTTSDYYVYVYPHPIYNGTVWGIDTGSTNSSGLSELKFYRKSGKNIYIMPAAVDTNLRSDNFHFKNSTTNTNTTNSYLLTSSSGAYKAYATDYAGNNSDPIDFNIIDVSSLRSGYETLEHSTNGTTPGTDLLLPAITSAEQSAAGNGITFSKDNNSHVNAYKSYMPYQASAFEYTPGTTWQLNAYGYVLKKFTNNWQLKVNIHDYAGGNDTYAPLEKYGIVHSFSDFSSDRSTAWQSHGFIPVEPSIWHDYQDAEGNYATGTNTSSQSKPNVTSYVDDGDIIINLPNENCPPLVLWLKDGCGNTRYVFLNPDLKEALGQDSLTLYTGNPDSDSYGKRNQTVSWIIDGTVGEDGYKPEGTHVYYSVTDSSNLVTEQSDVTYYKNNVSLNYTPLSDSCRFPTSQTADSTHYTMKSRVIVWTGASAPKRADFHSTSLVTSPAGSATASTWNFERERSNYSGNTSFSLSNSFPQYNSDSYYELWYIVEDTVGNTTIGQIKRADSTLAKWMYDVEGPTLNVPENGANKVNNIETGTDTSVNYYSSNSTVNYSISDTQSGIKNVGSGSDLSYDSPYRHSYNPTDGFSLENVIPDGAEHITISGVLDWAGNSSSQGLEFGGSSVWRKQGRPVLSSVSAAAIDSENHEITTGFWKENGGTASDGLNIKITSKAANDKIKVKLAVTDSVELLGWYVTDTQFDSSDPAIADTAFYDKNLFARHATNGTVVNGTGGIDGFAIDYDSTNNVYSYTAQKADTTSAWPASTKYFYPVNRAGLIGAAPIKVEFEANPVPAIGSISYNNVVTYVDSATSQIRKYTKQNSSISFYTDAVTPTGEKLEYKIFGENESSPYVSGELTGAGTIREIALYQTGAAINNISNATLNLKLYYKKTINGTEETVAESDVYPLTGSSTSTNNEHWSFDETAPSISITASGIQAATETAAGSGTFTTKGLVNYSSVNYLRGDFAQITYTTSDSDIAKVFMSTNNGTSYTEITGSVGSVDTTNKIIRFAAPVSAFSYLFKAEDEAGNTQTTAVPATAITLKKDNAGPVITDFTPVYKKNGSTVLTTTNYKVTTDANNVTTILYQPTEITQIEFNYTAADGIDASHTSEGSGCAGIFYRETGTSTAGTQISSNTLTLANMDSGTSYDIFAKDQVGNETPIKTYIFTSDNTAPNFTLADEHKVKANATTDAYLNNGTYYVNGTSAIVSFATTTSGDIDHYEWDQGTGTYTSVSVTDLAYTIASIPTTAVSAATAVTYNFVAVDKVGNRSTPAIQIKLVTDIDAPVVADATPVTYTAYHNNSAVTDTSKYIASGTDTITFTYNPATVNKLVFDFSGVSDAGSDIEKFVYRTGSPAADTTITDGEVSLLNASNAITGTYQIYAIDHVGNEKLLKTFVFRTNKPTPATTATAKYNNVDRDHISNNAYTVQNDELYVTGENGQSHTLYIPNREVTFTISMNKDTVPDNELYYGVTYISHSDSLPTPSEPASYSSVTLDSNGKFNAIINGTQLTATNNYIFIWFKDKIGNKSNYGISYSRDRENTWWSVDKDGPTGSISLSFKKSDNNNADNKYKSESGNTTTFNGNKIAKVTVDGANGLSDSGCGITSKVLYYREENATGDAANGTQIGNTGIDVSTLTDGTTYEIFAKDNWGNVKVFKKIVADKTGPALGNITVGAYGFYKQNETSPVAANNGYEELAPTADNLIEFKVNPGLKKFKVEVSSSESGVTIRKNSDLNNAYNGEIGLYSSAEVSIIAYDSLWVETVVRKYKFTIDSNNTDHPLTNIISTGGTDFTPVEVSTISAQGAYDNDSTPRSRILQFFNNVQESFTPETETQAQEAPAEPSLKQAKKAAKKAQKKAKKASKKPAAVDQPAVTIAEQATTTVTEKTSVVTAPAITELAANDIESVGEAVSDVTVIEATAEIPAAPVDAEPEEKSSSKTAVLVVMLAILSSLGGAWYYQRGRKK